MRGSRRPPVKREKVRQVMGEFRRGTLHSGSKSGPRVESRRQAVAIALSQGRRALRAKRRRRGTA